VGGVVTILATTFSLLPERLDVTHVIAAYGAPVRGRGSCVRASPAGDGRRRR
jgi:hypothetical protein